MVAPLGGAGEASEPGEVPGGQKNFKFVELLFVKCLESN
jgi:hypothetical protein